jgi:hypothetical protein
VQLSGLQLSGAAEFLNLKRVLHHWQEGGSQQPRETAALQHCTEHAAMWRMCECGCGIPGMQLCPRLFV